MYEPQERRKSPRCGAVKNRSSIEVATEQGSRRIEARLINISREGALVAMDNPPRPTTPISLRIETPVKTDWVEATIVRLDQQQRIGVQFTQSSPDDLILAGTVGIDLALMVRGGINGSTVYD